MLFVGPRWPEPHTHAGDRGTPTNSKPPLTRPSAVEVVLAAALAGIAVQLVWRSRGWPLIHDAPLMHYVAWRIAHGAVPYRDIFDMNAPGVYLTHLAVLRTLGAGDVAWRAFDLGWLGLTSLLLGFYAWPYGPGPAAIAGLLFAVYHVAGGAWLAGQRDFLLCAYLVAGALLVLPPAGLGRLLLAGVVVGAGATVKPPAVLFLALLAGAAAVGAAGGRARWRAALAVLAGGAMAPLAGVGWVASTGGLRAFVADFAGYVIPLYSRLARVSPRTALGWWPFGWRIWALLAVLVVAAGATRRSDLRGALALGGVGYGVVHFVLQGKGWEYQLYPLGAFACLAAGLAFATPTRWARWGAAVALALLALQLHVKGVRESHAAWIAAKAERVGRIVADLDGRLGPRDTVQVLDTGEGGIHALLRLGVREPTRFIYDFHFFHDADRPAVRRLRAEFMAELGAEPPEFIVLLKQGWPAGGYERIERFRRLAAFIAARYRLDREGAGYRIYAKRAGS